MLYFSKYTIQVFHIFKYNFTDQGSKMVDIEDKINVTLVIN